MQRRRFAGKIRRKEWGLGRYIGGDKHSNTGGAHVCEVSDAAEASAGSSHPKTEGCPHYHQGTLKASNYRFPEQMHCIGLVRVSSATYALKTDQQVEQ